VVALNCGKSLLVSHEPDEQGVDALAGLVNW
jgi:hypothetical protein